MKFKGKQVIMIFPFLLFYFLSLFAFSENRPNVILIVTDDQGYGEIAAHGNPIIETPCLDKLHDESIRFTNFHVDPTCAPTRGALMTGKFAHHARVWHTVRGGNHLRASEITMADVFKYNKYNTAIFGKWHLGANYPYRPIDRGFDEWLGLGDGGPNTTDGYFWNDRVNDYYWHNGEREYREGFNPDVFFGAATDYITKYKSDEPFFVYLPTYVPHAPYTFPTPDFSKKYRDKRLNNELAAYYASIEHVDGLIGRLRKTLEEEGIAKNTILIFITDNGSTHWKEGYNAGMSGGKGSVLEGGHRVPCFINWPAGGLITPRDINALTAHIDLLPTLGELCNLTYPKPIDFDGKSLAPLLKNENYNWKERTLVVEKQRVEKRTPEVSSIMNGNWRLVNLKKLYNIKDDPGQLNDVAEAHPEQVKKLLADFENYWKRVIPDDRSQPAPIVGTPFDTEIYLGVSELRSGKAWNHGHCAAGMKMDDVWHIEVAQAGKYEIEVRRWPREAEAPFAGIPEIKIKNDTWNTSGPLQSIMYVADFVSLPVKYVSLQVGTFFQKREINNSDTQCNFVLELPKGKTTLKASLFDKENQFLTSAYYVYIRKK